MNNRHTRPILLLVFVSLAAGIVGAGCLLYRSQHDSCRTEAEHDLAAVADLKVNDLSMWRKERLADANVFYKNNAFSALVRRCIERPQDLALQEELRTWIEHFRASNHYDRIALLDDKGDRLITVSDTGEPLSALTQQNARYALRSGQLTFTDFYRNDHTGKVYLRLFVPILDGQAGSRPLGVLMLRINPKRYLYPFIQRWPTPSKTAETLLVHREGNEAIFLNELKFQKHTALALRVSLDNTDCPAVRAALGQEGIVEGVDYRGVPVLAALRAVPDSPWILVARMDAAEVYTPMRERLWLVILFVGALLFGMAAAVGFLWRQQHLTLYRQKCESESRMRVITDSAKDAILMMDPQGRISYWNPAAERILGYTSADALGQNLHQLIAPQRYHETHRAAFPEFQRSGRGGALGKTLELEARRKDGQEVPVALSLSSIEIGGEWHAVGLMRDETERKRAEDYCEKLLVRRQGINLLQQSLLEPAPVEDKLRKITDGIVRLFDADFCRIWLIRPGDLCQGKCIHAEADDGPHACRRRDQCLHLLASSGRYTHIDGQSHRRVPIGCYKIGRVASGEDHKFLTNDAPNDLRVHNHQWARELGLVSFAGYQIGISGGNILGVLALFAKHPIDESEDAMLDGLSAAVGLAVEQAAAQESLRESGDRLRRVIETSPDAIALVEVAGRILLANQQAARLMGFESVEELLSQVDNAYDLLAPEDHQRARDNLGELMESGILRDIEYRGVRRDGSRFPAEISFSLERDPQGGPKAAILVFRDITIRKEAAALLQRAKETAEAANRAKSTFLTNMSHEIRTPMTAILGFADLLREEIICCPVCAESATCQRRRVGREAVDTIQRNGEHLLGVINDILDLSKIESEKFQIDPTPCSPIQLVTEVVSMMRVRAAVKHLELKTELACPLPKTVLTDPLRLRQVLVNLVGNAIKFTDQGEIRLAVRLISEPSPPRLCFDVTDTGVGMNEMQVGKLFQPFNQADSSPTRKFGGTGLGLCISKYLAEALGGHIEVRSEPGKGSTFSVTIDPGPLDGSDMIQNAQEALFGRPLTSSATARGRIVLHGRILLAEDGLDNQRLICLLLEKAGADATAVENGQLAVEAALAARDAGEPFDLILMDMQMPVMDGYEATRQLRQCGYTAPIVALTAHAMAEDCQKCLDAGCDDYATKPIDRQKLLATVAPWVARGRTQGDSPDSSIGDSTAGTTVLPTSVASPLAADADPGKLVGRLVQEMPDQTNALDAQPKSPDYRDLS